METSTSTEPLHHGGAFAYVVHVAFLLGLTLQIAWASWHFFERPILKRAVAFARRWQDAHTSPARSSA
jgi:peptidoglycan/LPS O-acetylase OafA/YrhL